MKVIFQLKSNNSHLCGEILKPQKKSDSSIRSGTEFTGLVNLTKDTRSQSTFLGFVKESLAWLAESSIPALIQPRVTK